MQATKKSNAAGMHFVLHTLLRRGRKKKKMVGKWEKEVVGNGRRVGGLEKMQWKILCKGRGQKLTTTTEPTMRHF